VSVRDYSCALAITHEYDSSVAREGLRALVAVPARVHGHVSVVLYGGIRAAMSIGDRAVADLMTVARQLSLDLEAAPSGAKSTSTAVDSSSGEGEEIPGRDHWRAVVEGIVADLAGLPERPVHKKARTTCLELLDVLRGETGRGTSPDVRPSDLRVLELAALGCTDRDIAEHLGIALHTVRRRMRMLRTTFGVHSRYAAVSAARAAGVLS
jgi:DNA-binding CsgD family transcriptional regulator